MKVIGMYDTKGKLIKYRDEVQVSQLSNRLMDKDGTTWATKDSYGDWVSPESFAMGIKRVVAVSE
jgi:hypothetical protein